MSATSATTGSLNPSLPQLHQPAWPWGQRSTLVPQNDRGQLRPYLAITLAISQLDKDIPRQVLTEACRPGTDTRTLSIQYGPLPYVEKDVLHLPRKFVPLFNAEYQTNYVLSDEEEARISIPDTLQLIVELGLASDNYPTNMWESVLPQGTRKVTRAAHLALPRFQQAASSSLTGRAAPRQISPRFQSTPTHAFIPRGNQHQLRPYFAITIALVLRLDEQFSRQTLADACERNADSRAFSSMHGGLPYLDKNVLHIPRRFVELHNQKYQEVLLTNATEAIIPISDLRQFLIDLNLVSSHCPMHEWEVALGLPPGPLPSAAAAAPFPLFLPLPNQYTPPSIITQVLSWFSPLTAPVTPPDPAQQAASSLSSQPTPPPINFSSTFGPITTHSRGTGPVIQPPQGPGEKSLRKFDLLDFSTRLSHPVYQGKISELVQRIRTVGGRRPERWKKNLPSERVRHEAKFLGITEVEYKQILCTEDPSKKATVDKSSFLTWEQEIQNEVELSALLQDLNRESRLDPTDPRLEQLSKLLSSNPPLSKPIYLSQLFHIYSLCKGLPQEWAITRALRKTAGGVNSRRLNEFCHESLELIQKRYPRTTLQDILSLLSKSIIAPAVARMTSPDTERLTIREKITADIELIRKMPRPSSKLELLKMLEANNLPLYIQGECSKISDADVGSFLGRTIDQLQQVQRFLEQWHGSNPRYYHATKSWQGVAESSILVGGGQSMHGGLTNYSGAFVSKEGPIDQYGDVCFCFTEGIETIARTVQTARGISAGGRPNAYWYGFTRAIPVNSQADDFKKQCLEELYQKIPLVQGTCAIEQQCLRISAMRWLENWTTASFSERDGWQFAMRKPEQGQVLENNPIEIEKQLKQALMESFPHFQREIDSISFPALPSRKPNQPPLLAQATDPCVIFAKKEAGSIDAIRQQLRIRGIPETIPVLPWETGAIWANYIQQIVGITRPVAGAKKKVKHTEFALHPEGVFF